MSFIDGKLDDFGMLCFPKYKCGLRKEDGKKKCPNWEICFVLRVKRAQEDVE